MRSLFLALFLLMGCASSPQLAELNTFCEEKQITFECRLASAVKANTKFVQQATGSQALSKDDKSYVLNRSEQVEFYLNLADKNSTLTDLTSAESLLFAIEEKLIALGEIE